MQTTAIMEAGQSFNDTVYYYVKDYQGNVRSVVREDGAVVESNEYYPYGGLFSATPSVQPYKYGAKELDRTHGLDWYDSKARFYDSILLRTNSMDKKAGDYTWLSPYLWCAANPIRFTDPSGMYILGKDGQRVSLNMENKELSTNLLPSQKIILNAMLKTEIGTQRLTDMLDAKYSISIRLEKSSLTNNCGETTTTINRNSDGEKEIARVTIVLFEDEIKSELTYKTVLSVEEKIGAVATHEARHATDKKANLMFETVKDKERHWHHKMNTNM